ncbi:B3 domain-containing transcription factor VRN1 [Melia azedarach]|uniref:B3 domain-containing transcription factor VRN1 n=1 Tax=Melia azedarach TaxID=155640 RepID=A0ACC1XY66_MELAZ|nr:B3 domain-containing transcription factor VRN1 [Melia azedarach]
MLFSVFQNQYTVSEACDFDWRQSGLGLNTKDKIRSICRGVRPILENSLPEPPHFFKIVLTSTLEEKKLRIPQKFVRKFGHELPNTATLIVPNGSCWSVDLKKDGKNVWFCDGWHEFVETHSISAGYFLVFKYGKNSRFHVLIFDLTACEIDYLCNDKESKNNKQNSEFLVDMDSDKECVQISEEQFHKMYSPPTQHNQAKPAFSTWRIKRNPQSPFSLEKSKVKRRCGQQRKKNIAQEFVEINEPNDDQRYDLWDSLAEMGICITEKYKLLSAENRKRLLNIAKSMKPKNPSFMVLLQPRNKYCRDVYVPSTFAQKFITKDTNSIKVQVSDGAEYSLQICWRQHGGFFLSKGWSHISEDKKLKVGDICIFELVRKKDVLLKLRVFDESVE